MAQFEKATIVNLKDKEVRSHSNTILGDCHMFTVSLLSCKLILSSGRLHVSSTGVAYFA